ncbi:hypothetical protein BWI17_04965 [Betaproteobacteria bacterium GR16-43]|nr:hypothetical protein BWI17_04965 [Betaproteobacteria bacterium GR16-43]
MKTQKRSPKSQQSGFTLVEIAIVLVIIGLLLGGILKGQELINSAKVKAVAGDFRTIPTFVYGYQDKFRALPGDDLSAVGHLTGATPAPTNGNGNGVIEGSWNSCATGTYTAESMQFWQQVRLAGLAPGGTTMPIDLATCADFLPKNAFNGMVGLSSYRADVDGQISGMSGTYQICSDGILGKFVVQLDLQMDDGKTATGSMRAVANGSAVKTAATDITTVTGYESQPFIVCYTF